MRILVAEDEKKVIRFIKKGFEKEGFQVDTAKDGEEAILKAVQAGYDLILLDISLPKKDGLTVIKELREKQISAPILCLTAKDTVEDIVTGLDTGSDGYLTKPFDLSELVARVQALIRRGINCPGAELAYADLRLDPVSHKVWRNGVEIPLFAKEYAVLEYFMRHPEQVLTREMITANIWTEKIDVFSKSIEVYINYLRVKLGQEPDTKLIHTIRGVGYVLKERA